jgi:hypothetical protein
MQNERIVVPNSLVVERKIRLISFGELAYDAPISDPALVRRLVRRLNREYGIKLKGTDIQGKNAFRAAGIVQAHVFYLRSAQEESDAREHADTDAVALAAVAKVIASAINREYGLKLLPSGIRNVSVEQLCAKVVRIQNLKNHVR